MSGTDHVPPFTPLPGRVLTQLTHKQVETALEDLPPEAEWTDDDRLSDTVLRYALKQPGPANGRGPIPDPNCIDWQSAVGRLYAACRTVPIKMRDRTPAQQAAVEDFTQAMVEVSDVLHGPELGLMGAPVEPIRFVKRKTGP